MDEFMSAVNSQFDEVNLKMDLVKSHLDNHDYESAKNVLSDILKLAPDEPNANFVLGQLYEFEENYERAVDCFERIMKYYPSPELQQRLAGLYENMDQYEKAYELYKSMYEINPEDVETLLSLTHVCQVLDKKTEAVENYNKLLKNDPDNIVALSQLVELYQEEDKLLYYLTKARINELESSLSHATANYKKALTAAENQDDIIQIRHKLAKILTQREKFQEAAEEYQHILHLDPQNFKIYKKLGEIYSELENTDLAIDCLEKAAEINPEDSEILKELADLYSEMEEFEKSRELLEKLVIIEPQNDSNKINLAKIMLSLNDKAQALEIINSVLATNEKNVEAISVMVDYYISKEQLTNALVYAEKIRQILPNSPLGYRKTAEAYEHGSDAVNSHYYYGIFHELKGEKEHAMDEFTCAFQAQPDNSDLAKRLAKLYEDAGENYVAIDYYEKAYHIDENDFVSLEKAANLFRKLGEIEQALKLLETIESGNPAYADINFLIGECYFDLKQYEPALKYYKKFLETARLSQKTEEAENKVKLIENKYKQEEDEGFLNKVLGFFFRGD